MCRGDLDRELYEGAKGQEIASLEELRTEIKWVYAGRNEGWWYFDPETSKEIDLAWVEGEDKIEIEVSGYEYTMDLNELEQNSHNGMVRKIKRVDEEDTDGMIIKGIAGLSFDSD